MSKKNKDKKHESFQCDSPLLVNPILALKIGLHEAMILEQVEYWIAQKREKNLNLYDGYHWTFNSYPEWQKQFPFWDERTIRRLIKNLEKKGLLKTGVYNRLKIDRTKWYRIDYFALDKALKDLPCGQNVLMDTGKMPSSSGQNDLMDADSLTSPLPESTLENTTEIIPENTIILSSFDFVSVFKYLRGKYSIEYKRIHGEEPEFKHLMTLQEFVRHYVDKNNPNQIELDKIIAKHFESGSHSVSRFFSELGRVS